LLPVPSQVVVGGDICHLLFKIAGVQNQRQSRESNLWPQGGLQCECSSFNVVRKMQHAVVSVRTATCVQAELQEYLQDVLTEAGVEHVDELLSANVAKDWPRTARVNLLKISVAEALAWLRSPPLEHQKLATLVRCITVLCDVLQCALQKSKQYVCALSKQSNKKPCGMQCMQLVGALM
jgi:acetylglutamate synthase